MSDHSSNTTPWGQAQWGHIGAPSQIMCDIELIADEIKKANGGKDNVNSEMLRQACANLSPLWNIKPLLFENVEQSRIWWEERVVSP